MKILLLITLLFAGIASADVYKWTDTQGHVHFSDKPNHALKSQKIIINTTQPQKDPRKTTSDPETKAIVTDETAKQVTMYATSWCGYCKKAREHFRINHIPYIEYDIETNLQAKIAYDQLGGLGVPVILVGDARMNGFDAAGFDELYSVK